MTPRALWLAAIALVGVDAKACEGYDLPNDTPLRIGVKYKPPDCKLQSGKGDELRIGYTALLYKDCSKYEESYYEGHKFTLGKEHVISAWDQGLNGMCVFEKRKLTAAADHGYGEEGRKFFPNSINLLAYNTVPPNATLVFEVELLGINGKKPKGDKGREPGSQAAAAKKKLKPKPAKEDANPYRRGFGMGGFDSGNDDLSGMEAARNMVQRSRMEQEMAKDEV